MKTRTLLEAIVLLPVHIEAAADNTPNNDQTTMVIMPNNENIIGKGNRLPWINQPKGNRPSSIGWKLSCAMTIS